jgi:lipopolysaccharide transport system ATP-binding protein
MSNTAIKVENLSKIYRLGEIGTGTISRDMERWFKTRVLKQEDPFLKIGERNDRSKRGVSDIVYSLKDINFSVEKGTAVGIIGRNGAGKSTLLKILSRVTTPSKGRINIKGRVASLLEVGTGFHPELTGRENIYLNGAILGMRKREIDRKLEEIIAFSGVERYVDTPVKRYSSGMYVRLAFAVAAHLESEILIIDEVLAVGDAEFQNKCLGKMNEISKGEGKTVLFVSHNLAAVKRLCTSGILFDAGKIATIGDIVSVLNDYSSNNNNNLSKNGDLFQGISRIGTLRLKFTKFTMNGNDNFIRFNEEMKFEIEAFSNSKIKNVFCEIKIANHEFCDIVHSTHVYQHDLNLLNLEEGPIKFNVEIENNLQPGIYWVSIAAFQFDVGENLDQIENFYSFEIKEYGNSDSYFFPKEWSMAIVRSNSKWKIIK